MGKDEYSKRKLMLVQVGLVAFLLLVWLILWRISKNENHSYNLLLWIFPYLALLITLSFFTRYKPIRILHTILWIPGLALIAVGPVMQIMWSFIYTYLMIVGGTVIVVSLVPKYLFNYQFEFPASIYLILTISSIIATTLSEKFIKSVHKAQNKPYSEYSERISIKLFGQSNIRFAIFVLYFILLIVFNLASLNRTPLLNSEQIATSILQSFATYVAFDRILSNWNLVKKQFEKVTNIENGA